MSSTSTTQNSPPSPRSWMSGRNGKPASRLTRRPARFRAPYLVVGLLLVIVCAVGGVLTVMAAGQRQPVLTLARPLTVGQIVTQADLATVSISADPDAGLLTADQASSVVGQPVAYSLPAGTPLTRAAVGPAQVPGQGQSIVAVAVKPGQFPPQVAAGHTVDVIAHAQTTTGETGTSAAVAGPVLATVESVEPAGSDDSTVVSLRIAQRNASDIASVPAGGLSLVIVPGRP